MQLAGGCLEGAEADGGGKCPEGDRVDLGDGTHDESS
jgi:hypothetical protein